MVRAGVSLPALMTLLGHVKAEMTMKSSWSLATTCNASSTLPALNPGIWRHSLRRRPFRLAQAWKVLSIRYSSLNTPLRCSGDPYQTAPRDTASIASPIASARFSLKPANSTHPDNGQRLAG